MKVARHIWSLALATTLAAIAVLVAVGVLAQSRGAPLPPRVPCTTDLDCPGCIRCVGGLCGDAEWGGPTCMCHDECARAAAGACDLSTTKPLCGGLCVAATPARPLVCGGGDDVVTVEALAGTAGAIQASPAAAVSGETIAVERGARP
jgi:hypothetical protein